MTISTIEGGNKLCQSYIMMETVYIVITMSYRLIQHDLPRNYQFTTLKGEVGQQFFKTTSRSGK